jgi:hypothetical protein
MIMAQMTTMITKMNSGQVIMPPLSPPSQPTQDSQHDSAELSQRSMRR